MQSAISTPATLQIALGRAVPPIAADVGQLRQVILGIITNSNEALGGGGGVIRVKTGELEVGTNGQADYEWSERLAPGRFAVLDVADTGPGMDQATLARVFEPFFTTKFTGRGLGLAAIQGIVRSHGGAIGVTSELGAGTTFRLLFPALPELLAG